MKKVVCFLLAVLCAMMCVTALASSDIQATPYTFDFSGYDVTLSDIKVYKANKTETQENALVYVVSFSLLNLPTEKYSGFFDSFSNEYFIAYYEDGNYASAFDPILYTTWVDSKTATLVFATEAINEDSLQVLSLLVDYTSDLPFAFVKTDPDEKVTEINLKQTLYIGNLVDDEIKDLSTLDYYLYKYINVLCGYEGRSAK